VRASSALAIVAARRRWRFAMGTALQVVGPSTSSITHQRPGSMP